MARSSPQSHAEGPSPGGGGGARRRFSRHAKLETLLRYDDNRRDEAGAIAKLLGEDSAW